MARKSRKNLPQPEQATVSVQFPELMKKDTNCNLWTAFGGR